MTLTRRMLLASFPPLAAALSATAQETFEPIALRWSRPFPRLSELAVSSDGRRIAALSLDGNLSCFDLEGHLLWERPSVAANALAVSSTGDLIAAWQKSSAVASKLLLFSGAGRCFAAPNLQGAPDCLAISSDGKRVAVGADDLITLIGIGAKGLVTRQIHSKGQVKRLLPGVGDTFYVLTDAPCRLALIKSRGAELWHRDLPERGNCSAGVSSDGKQLALAYEKSPKQLEILLLTWKNEELWRTARDGRGGSIRMNAEGGVVFLAFDYLVEHQQQSRFERRLAYLGESGVGGWVKGGALTTPLLVSLDSEGKWVVALDNERSRGGSRFRLYGIDGTRQWIYTAPVGIHLATSSASGRTVAVYQADGTLSLLTVNTMDGAG